jgi:hypothetical protein
MIIIKDKHRKQDKCIDLNMYTLEYLGKKKEKY